MEQKLSRREFLRLAALAGAGFLLPGCTDRFPNVAVINKKLPEIKNGEVVWKKEDLISAWKRAVKTAEISSGETVLDLPEGEIFIDQKVSLDLPDGMQVRLRSHKNGTIIRAAETLSVLPDPITNPGESYRGQANNLLEIKVGKGSVLGIEDIVFHGGSERAGNAGYKAPKGPWNAMIAVYGKGGEGHDNKDVSAKGSVDLTNCHFVQSEAPGVLLQNLESFGMNGCTGKNLDTLVTANWCRSGEINGCYGQNMLSDFVFAVWSQNLMVNKCGIDLAWSGYNFRGCNGVRVNDCYAGYCLAAGTTSEVIPGTNEVNNNIAFQNFSTYGCSCVYALQHVSQIWLAGGVHDELGLVLNAESFMQRVSNPEWIAEQPIYLGPNVTDLVSQGQYFRKSDKAPDIYSLKDQVPGSVFYNF